MNSNMGDSPPKKQFAFDVNKSKMFEKDNKNFINVVGIDQLNSLENVSLLDFYLSAENVIEPHYHQNASELIYCISGAFTVSLMNPSTKKFQSYPLTPGQVTNVPQGWWHYIVATADNTHFLGIFDAPTPEVILGSDLLKFTPPQIMAHTYCMDENQWKKAIAPVKPSTTIGPPKDCDRATQNIPNQNAYHTNQYSEQMHPYTYQHAPYAHYYKR